MTTTKLNDLFDQMDDEKGNKIDDKIKIEETDLDIDNLFNILEELSLIYGRKKKEEYFRNKISNKYTSKQITKFSLLLNEDHIEKFDDYDVVELLNFLINNSKDKIHNVHTSHLNHKIVDLGYKLEDKIMYIHGDAGEGLGTKIKRSKIIINGDCRYDAGYCMSSGEILVKGNCEFAAGFDMKGGLIVVEGNCEDSLAKDMHDGKIIVKGNTGRYTGSGMKGGVVKIYGEIESLSNNIFKGDIYHKDELIVKNGEILDRSYLK